MSAPAAAREALARLQRWLTEDALPLWWAAGADLSAGGFHDRLSPGGTPAPGPKRVRVQARQAHVYALAAAHSWMPGAEAAARHGLYALASLRRADGLYRMGEARAEIPLDGMGELYDQAFVLLALASGRAVLGDDRLERAAAELRERLSAFAHPLGGYAEASGLAEPLFANPNMHLFESFQAWSAVSADPVWSGLAAGQARLALTRLIDPATGALFEAYAADWRTLAAPTIWPGHLYEWGFLLLRRRGADEAARAAALRLIELAERHGVDHGRGVAMFALDGALAATDRGARLWAQTERLRAAALAATLFGRSDLWDAALQACGTLERFLATPTPGLWRDWMDAAGAFREEPAPASSLYHIVGAIAELERLIAA